MSKQQLKKKTSSFFVPLLKIYIEDDAEKEEEEERQRESESQPRRTKTGDGEHRERICKGGSYGKWCAVVSHTFFSSSSSSCSSSSSLRDAKREVFFVLSLVFPYANVLHEL